MRAFNSRRNTASSLELVLTAPARTVRGVPGLHVSRVLETCAIMMPTMGEPSPLFVQLPQVVWPPAVEYIPSGSEPVRMSWVLTASPLPPTSAFSVSAVSFLMLTVAECRVIHALGQSRHLWRSATDPCRSDRAR